MRRLAVAILMMLATGYAGALFAADADVVDAYLAKLGLADLQVLHLEQTLATEKNKEVQQQYARRLADLYAERLVVVSDDEARFDEIGRRVAALTELFPKASTPALQVTLLQADYRRAEALILKWQEEKRDESTRAEAATILARIAPSLLEKQQFLNAETAKTAERLEKDEKRQTPAALERELQRQQVVAGRAAYFAGWASYYRGLTDSSDIAPQRFADARDAFRHLLGIEGDIAYKNLTSDQLGLDSIWRARAAVGLALAEYSLQNTTAGEEIFAWLESPGVAPSLRDQLLPWKLQGLVNAHLFGAAARFAEPQLERLGTSPTPGKIAFCAMLLRTGYADGGRQKAAEEKWLGDLGIQGLAKLRQFPLLRQMIEKYKIDLSGRRDFYLVWMQGHMAFSNAEKNRNNADYQQAIQWLSQALLHADAHDDPSSAGHCRGTLAWCWYRLEQFEKAGREFLQASDALKKPESAAAADNAWMAFVAYQQLSAKWPQFSRVAIDTLEKIKRDFPGSDQATKADYHIAKLQKTAVSPDESLRQLKQLKPGDANYWSARFEICQLNYQRWLKLREGKRTEKDEALSASEIIASVEVLMRDAPANKGRVEKLKASLMAADVLINSSAPDIEQAKHILNRVAAMAKDEAADSALAAEYHYRWLQIAQREKNEADAIQQAQWLVKNGLGSSFELPALVIVARHRDQAVQNAGDDQKNARRQAAADIYQRLVELLGDSPHDLSTKKNAQVASSKLAQYQSDLGQHAAASLRLEKLLAAYPHDRGYLRRAGLALVESGKHSAALEKWRTLLGGLEKGSDDWFEAKYFQLFCLATVDPALAKTVFSQFKLLHADLGPLPRREKFASLEKALFP